MATIQQQIAANMILVNSIANECQKMQSIVAKAQGATAALDPDNPADTTVTISPADKAAILAAWNAHLTNIKTSAASLVVAA